MFTADDVQARVRQQPFMPLRVVTTSGQSYDIHHPDLIMIGRRAVIIGSASNENPAHFDQVSRVAILHISELQDLPLPAATSGNGAI